jgi:cytochrome c oxidase accessory protein FixG
MQFDREHARGQMHPRRLAKYAVYLALSLFLAHTFLAYFVGIDRLVTWVQRSPVEHPTSFFIMAFTTAAIMADFTWFREQTCLVACPYGRFQSVLLDRQSLIVAYDGNRGEPRGRGKERAAGAGDCIDCGACVLTCPTGIDIRDGLQMECIHCTQCADACDAIMQKVGKPAGLIRYTSQEALAGHKRHILRPRTLLYPAAFALFFGGFLVALATRPRAEVTLLGAIGEPFTREPDGTVVNQVRIRVQNRSATAQRFELQLLGDSGARVLAPEFPLTVGGGKMASTSVFVMLPSAAFHDGEHRVRFRLSGGGFREEYPLRLRGPSEHRDDRHEEEKR